MTPLWVFFDRWLPRQAVWPALTLTYALALFLLLIVAQVPEENIIYIDLEVMD